MAAGLKLDDVRNEWHPDVQTALSRLTEEELSNRNKRLKRAMDLSLKHSELNKDAQATIEPFVGYLPLERAREERLERYFNPCATVVMFCRLASGSDSLSCVRLCVVSTGRTRHDKIHKNGREG